MVGKEAFPLQVFPLQGEAMNLIKVVTEMLFVVG